MVFVLVTIQYYLLKNPPLTQFFEVPSLSQIKFPISTFLSFQHVPWVHLHVHEHELEGLYYHSFVVHIASWSGPFHLIALLDSYLSCSWIFDIPYTFQSTSLKFYNKSCHKYYGNCMSLYITLWKFTQMQLSCPTHEQCPQFNIIKCWNPLIISKIFPVKYLLITC